MTLPALPSKGSTDWYAWAQGVDAAARGGGGGGDTGGGGTSTTADFGAVALDSFAGAGDDAKLTAALSAVAADTYPRTIQLTNRQYTFSTVNRAPFDGMRIAGPPGFGNPERRTQTKMPGRVHLNGAGPWFAATSNVYSCSLTGLSFTGGSGAWVIGGTGDWRNLMMTSIYSHGLRSVVGSIADKALLVCCYFDVWQINNSYDLAVHAGGSDNMLWPSFGQFDSATSYAGDGQAHIWLDFMEKTDIGPLYITAEQSWSGIRVTGPAFNSTGNNQGGPLTFHGMRVEGRNKDASSYGSLIRVEGGIVVIRDSWASYAMSDPANASIGRTDAGVISHTGGTLIVDGCTYDRATGVAETVPFVYTSSNADCIVRNTMRASKGGTWTGRPRVALKSGNAENRSTDSTVTLVTV